MSEILLTDCPRDAIQGIKRMISAEKKAAHINRLLRSGLFDRVDFGSFVSPRAVPQMADTEDVLEAIGDTHGTKLLAIVLNERGAETGLRSGKVDFFGYPFSLSEEFQRRNANSTVAESYERLQRVNARVAEAGRETEVLSFHGVSGNPYGESWSEQLVVDWIGKISGLGIREFSLADTTGEADAAGIQKLFKTCSEAFPALRIGAHFHSERATGLEKIRAAHAAGCKKFDGALLGYGGCQFAQNELVGNMASEDLLNYFGRGNQEQIAGLQASFRDLISSSLSY
ncbi:MAG: hydroxymethylglutaryl-CoA lyase [Leadbetterella sp.]|nr:hydroxymethylglutaryl-CoA lyase [Leadbetterella sp.]